MSDFNLAIPYVLQHEGGFVDNPSDPGGATQFGISLRFLQQIKANVTSNDIRKLSQSDAIEIYQREWWQRYQYATIHSQQLATKVFDLAVNMGAHQAHICLQRAMRAANGYSLIEDGLLGPQSFHLINTVNPDILLAAFKSDKICAALGKRPRGTWWCNYWRFDCIYFWRGY